MTRGKALVWAAMLAATTMAGCAVHWQVDAYAVPDVAVAARSTYFWKGGDYAAARQIEPALIASAEQQVRGVVTQELHRKGYAEVDSAAAADLVVSYQVSGMRRFVSNETPRIGAPLPNTVLSPSETQPPPASEMPREVAVRDGSVILFLDDVKLGKLAWRGEVSDEVRAGSSQQMARIIAQMAREIARAVPARK